MWDISKTSWYETGEVGGESDGTREKEISRVKVAFRKLCPSHGVLCRRC